MRCHQLSSHLEQLEWVEYCVSYRAANRCAANIGESARLGHPTTRAKAGLKSSRTGRPPRFRIFPLLNFLAGNSHHLSVTLPYNDSFTTCVTVPNGRRPYHKRWFRAGPVAIVPLTNYSRVYNVDRALPCRLPMAGLTRRLGHVVSWLCLLAQRRSFSDRGGERRSRSEGARHASDVGCVQQ